MSKRAAMLKKLGLSLFLGGSLVFALPAVGDASSIGEELLEKGDEHEHVQKLQEMLNTQGYLDTDALSGKYDNATEEAVSVFQEKHNLLVDGIAGAETIGALSILRQGDVGEVVTALQEDLQTFGHYEAKIDGIFGPITHQAVKDLQGEQGISVDGLAGPETFGAIQQLKRKEESGSSGNGGNKKSSSASKESSSEESSSKESSSKESSSEESSSKESSSKESSSEESSSEESSSKESSSEESSSKESSSKESSSEESSSKESSSEEGSVEGSSESSSSKSAGSDQSGESSDKSTAGTASAEGNLELEVEATAYTANCEGCSGITATGLDLKNNPDKKVIAVDPDVIPLGSTVEVEGYGEAVAGDVGGAIKGNKIDVFIPDEDEALAWGRQTVTVKVLD